MPTLQGPKEAALAAMKQASRDTFKVCAAQAERLANQIEDGKVTLDAASALRFLAIVFQSSTETETEWE